MRDNRLHKGNLFLNIRMHYNVCLVRVSISLNNCSKRYLSSWLDKHKEMVQVIVMIRKYY